MKAAVFLGPGQKLSIESRPDPTPAAGQIVIQVERCGICGSDIHMTEAHGLLTPGSVLGHEFACEVVAVGAGVSGLRNGDRVTALPIAGCGSCEWCRAGTPNWCASVQWTGGGYAEYVAAQAQFCLKLPAGLSVTDGALVEPMSVGRHAVALANIRPVSNVLVMGAGPIGLAAAYWSKHFGAHRVAVTAASRRREQLAGLMGADAFIVNDADSMSAAQRVFGGLPDVVIECVGLPGMIARSVEFVRPRGAVIVAGACPTPDQFAPLAATIKEIRMQFAIVYSVEDFQKSIDAMEAGSVDARAMVTDTVDMAHFSDTFEALRKPGHHCKVMLAPWS